MLSIRRNKINPVAEAPADADAQQGASPDAQREHTIRQAQRRREMAEIKARLHRQLVERVDLSRFKADSQDHRAQLRKTLTDLVVQQCWTPASASGWSPKCWTRRSDWALSRLCWPTPPSPTF
jgi:hypothetical protein